MGLIWIMSILNLKLNTHLSQSWWANGTMSAVGPVVIVTILIQIRFYQIFSWVDFNDRGSADPNRLSDRFTWFQN